MALRDNGGVSATHSAPPARAEPGPPALGWNLVPALLVSGSAVLLFAFENRWGYVPLFAGLAIAWLVDRRFARDLGLVVLGIGIVSLHSMRADLSWGNMVVMGAVLAAAVVAPYAISRWVLRDHAVRFPARAPGTRWSRFEWGWLACVLLLGWLILPRYFITSGAYQNWPPVTEWHEIGRLFVGVNAVGIWDELFFMCVVFTLYRRHFAFWTANVLQAIVFVSFLWELGYREWGPALTIPFALVQGWIFTKTRSLVYVVTVHLLFDLIVFLTIVHAHHRGWIPIFWY